VSGVRAPRRADRGQALLEYALIIIVIGVTALFIVRRFGISVRCKLLESTAAVARADVPGLSGCPGAGQALASEDAEGSSPAPLPLLLEVMGRPPPPPAAPPPPSQPQSQPLRFTSPPCRAPCTSCSHVCTMTVAGTGPITWRKMPDDNCSFFNLTSSSGATTTYQGFIPAGSSGSSCRLHYQACDASGQCIDWNGGISWG
jgi:hypothetical protein